MRRWEKHDFKPYADDIFQERLYCIQWITKGTLGKSRPETFFSAVTDEDLDVVASVALSSGPRDRSELIKLLIRNGGVLTTTQIEKYLKIHPSTALRKIRELEMLELVEQTTVSTATKPSFAMKLKEDFEWLLTEKFADLNS